MTGAWSKYPVGCFCAARALLCVCVVLDSKMAGFYSKPPCFSRSNYAGEFSNSACSGRHFLPSVLLAEMNKLKDTLLLYDSPIKLLFTKIQEKNNEFSKRRTMTPSTIIFSSSSN